MLSFMSVGYAGVLPTNSFTDLGSYSEGWNQYMHDLYGYSMDLSPLLMIHLVPSHTLAAQTPPPTRIQIVVVRDGHLLSS